jgi:hypothetical protein
MEDKYTERPLLFHVNTQKREQTQTAIEAGISGSSRPRFRGAFPVSLSYSQCMHTARSCGTIALLILFWEHTKKK